MQIPTLTTGSKGEPIVTDMNGKATAFDLKKFGEAIVAFNAAMTAWQAEQSKASEKAEIKAQLTYRNELQIVGPSGFGVITGTQDTFAWLERHFATIMATFKANQAKIAADYSARPKALPKDAEKPKTPLALVTPAAKGSTSQAS